MTLDVPKMGTIGSGEVETKQTFVDIPAILLLLGPIRFKNKIVKFGQEF